jgi:hypothetical protein
MRPRDAMDARKVLFGETTAAEVADASVRLGRLAAGEAVAR